MRVPRVLYQMAMCVAFSPLLVNKLILFPIDQNALAVWYENKFVYFLLSLSLFLFIFFFFTLKKILN